MRAMMVFRQLLAVLDRSLGKETRKLGLSPEDVLLFAWIEQRQGISASTLARYAGRERQNTQASLERLKRLGFLQKFDDGERTVGWGFTSEGLDLWGKLSDRLRDQDNLLRLHGVTETSLSRMEELVRNLRRAPPHAYSPGLVEFPEEDDEISKWDV